LFQNLKRVFFNTYFTKHDHSMLIDEETLREMHQVYKRVMKLDLLMLQFKSELVFIVDCVLLFEINRFHFTCSRFVQNC
jgi:hypothetical protein